MRILHTADWHLGVSSGPVSRAEDHALFLAWLLELLEGERVDALVVAGDVFDSHQPSSTALAQYYRFLAQCQARLPHLQIVVVGGNHDAASRLQAPAEVLKALNVHVVGGLTQESRDAGDHVIPLRNSEGAVAAAVLAVPYVHEFRLGVRTTEGSREEVHAAFTSAFKQLYQELADRAQDSYPGVPILATGHLTVGKDFERADFPQEIHQVGTIDAMSPSLFDSRIQYVALGHIHRSYPTDPDRRVWYSGSPVPISVVEGRSVRRVLVVDLESGAAMAEPRAHEVPTFRKLVEIRGDLATVTSEIGLLETDQPLAPLLFVRVVQDEVSSGMQTEIQTALDARSDGLRPVLVELRHERNTALSAVELDVGRTLDALEVGDVFVSLVKARGEPVDAPLTAAFAELRSMGVEDFESRLSQVWGDPE